MKETKRVTSFRPIVEVPVIWFHQSFPLIFHVIADDK